MLIEILFKEGKLETKYTDLDLGGSDLDLFE